MSSLSLSSTVTLRNGGNMPLLGFGVFQSTSAKASTTAALNSGYRHFDSARYYANEAQVGEAVDSWKKSGGTGDVFLTSKVQGHEHGQAEKSVDDSIAKLKPYGLKWNLFLLHDPTSGKAKRMAAWKVLQAKQEAGLIKDIGVSNFSQIHLKEFKDAGLSTPAINQVELHPRCQQKLIVDYCNEHGIIVQAYCPLLRGLKMEDPTLVEVSKSTGKTPAQVLIRWALQRGFVPLPKSDTPSRIKANADVYDFEISKSDMAKLDGLDEGDAGAISWNPIHVA